jgi:hypothetical protein
LFPDWCAVIRKVDKEVLATFGIMQSENFGSRVE